MAELAAFLAAEKREAAWRREIGDGIRRLGGIGPGTRPEKNVRKRNGPDDALAAARIRADMLAMLEGEKEKG